MLLYLYFVGGHAQPKTWLKGIFILAIIKFYDFRCKIAYKSNAKLLWSYIHSSNISCTMPIPWIPFNFTLNLVSIIFDIQCIRNVFSESASIFVFDVLNLYFCHLNALIIKCKCIFEFKYFFNIMDILCISLIFQIEQWK